MSDDVSSSEGAFFGGELSAELAPGMIVADRYELVRKIGSGSMGDVWAARHLSLGEEVAIKLVVRTTAGDGSSVASRFLFEARIAAQLSRKTRHIVTVTDHGEHGAYAYLVMELLNGDSLESRLARGGPLSPAQVAPILTQVARAISIAHEEGIIHRDLKTSNVFLTVDEEGHALVKILDFGIAKARGSIQRLPPAGDRRRSLASAAMHATMHGFLLGTPPYMSPEQASGDAVDHRTDVWALGVMAYNLLTGEFPFDADTAESLFANIICGEPTPIVAHRSDLPASVASLFGRAFAPSIDDRFQTAIDFAHAFEDAATSELSSAVPFVMPSVRPGHAETILAAGVPRTKLAPLLFVGGAALAILGSLAAVLFIYFEPVAPSPTATTTVTMAVPPSPDLPVPPPSADPAPVPQEARVVLASAQRRRTPPGRGARAASAAPRAADRADDVRRGWRRPLRSFLSGPRLGDPDPGRVRTGPRRRNRVSSCPCSRGRARAPRGT